MFQLKNLKKDNIMPQGKGTYGTTVGRPPKKKNAASSTRRSTARRSTTRRSATRRSTKRV